MKRMVPHWLEALLWLALLACIGSVAGAIFGGMHPLIDLPGQFTLQAAFGATGLAALCLLCRLDAAAAAAALTALVAAFVVTVPAPIEACGAGVPTHRVLFQNLWVHNPNVGPTIEFLAESDADVIVVAENWSRFDKDLDRVRKTYPYRADCSATDCSNAIFSRVPLRSWPSERNNGVLVGATAEFPEGALDLGSVHLTRPWPYDFPSSQMRQTRRVARDVSEGSGIDLAIGDFNAVTWGAIIKRLSEATGLKPLPSGGTWRTDFPWPARLPIDQILVGADIACASKTVGPRTTSDHRPVWIDFALKPSPSP